jgi:hypothetical protein
VGVHPPPSPARTDFTLITECTPESSGCNSVYSADGSCAPPPPQEATEAWQVVIIMGKKSMNPHPARISERYSQTIFQNCWQRQKIYRCELCPLAGCGTKAELSVCPPISMLPLLCLTSCRVESFFYFLFFWGIFYFLSSLVVRASDCQCTSCNGPGFDPGIRRHSGI